MIKATDIISISLVTEHPLFLRHSFKPKKKIAYMKNVQLCTVAVPHNASLIYTNGSIDFVLVAQAFVVQAFQC